MATGTDLVLYERELEERVGEGGEMSGLDKRLLSMAASKLSPEEMSAELGGAIPPARCAQRVREILKSKDWLSITEQKAMLVLDLVRLRDTLFEEVERTTEVGWDIDGEKVILERDPRWAAVLTRLLVEFRKTIESTKIEGDTTAVMLREAHAQIMVSAISTAFERFVARIEQGGYQIPHEELMGYMGEVLPAAFQQVQYRTQA